MKLNIQLKDNGLISDIQETVGSDWVTAYQTANSKLPTIPKFLFPLVNNYTQGQVISQSIEVIPVSGQQWSDLTKRQKIILLELVEWLGKDSSEYCRQWQSMLPKGR